MQDLFLGCLNIKEEGDICDYEKLKQPEVKQQLRHVLKSYALLSKQKLAEQLFTDYVVKPYMSQFVNENYLESNIRKLNGVYEKILEFIDLNTEFLKITTEVRNKYVFFGENFIILSYGYFKSMTFNKIGFFFI